MEFGCFCGCTAYLTWRENILSQGSLGGVFVAYFKHHKLNCKTEMVFVYLIVAFCYTAKHKISVYKGPYLTSFHQRGGSFCHCTNKYILIMQTCNHACHYSLTRIMTHTRTRTHTCTRTRMHARMKRTQNVHKNGITRLVITGTRHHNDRTPAISRLPINIHIICSLTGVSLVPRHRHCLP